ncbi:CDP-diacylglycerol--serine O-phosphatidyltransferase [Paucidesulfovibrio longus]|jgi:CDP-diacylglycerol--serine O-phosphatidyltransferase|uniref:CDP-diacylglycerol--serine O-phosphatidyltransferase n=1 Tax=Paucidesulfovibrio longus TaxID=889 RepID=UPI0003B481FC|nr:CDP-diacylglycerol--serine O-phosphatidyltransferase [Paucidesulfovibrio longus]
MAVRKRLPRSKAVYILPNLFTTASLFLGFMGMVWSVRGDFESCALAILGSAVFDALDGRVARMTNTTSEFGVQYDSLADLVAFGVSPAILVYMWQLSQFGRLGLMASFLLVACGALRLARFNVQVKVTDKRFFTGLPIPAAACTLATLVLFMPFVPPHIAETSLAPALLVLVYLLSFLMVSTVRFASFKELGFLRAHSFSTMVVAILLFVLVATKPRVLGFLIFLAYIASGLGYTLFVLSRRGAKLSQPPHEDAEHGEKEGGR